MTREDYLEQMGLIKRVHTKEEFARSDLWSDSRGWWWYWLVPPTIAVVRQKGKPEE
jgi:hypothetical protein